MASRYRLTQPIGSGGVGVVWRGRDVLLDRAVAVKEIVQPASDETYQRTLREARAAARVKHPGVAAVYDVVSEDGRWYIVMELVEGRPLSQVIDTEGPLPSAVVADIGAQILAALKAGHVAGVLHRDLKPSNVLITPAGRAVLTDFGIASVAGDPSITRTGIVLGTPGYLAPERAAGEVATDAADLWSLGATLYAAAEGRGPYDSYSEVMAMMVAVISSDPPAPTVGEPLAGIISALLSRDPRRRPSTDITLRRLEAAAAAGAVPSATMPPTATAVADFEPVREDYGFSPSSPARPSWEPVSSLLQPGPSRFDEGRGSTTEVRRGGWDWSSTEERRLGEGRVGEGRRDGYDRSGPSRSGPGRSGPGRSGPGRGGYGGGRKPLFVIAGVAVAAVVAVTAVLLARPSGQQAALASNSVPPALTEQFRLAPVVAA
ncbi:MAG TPA: serine/threonine-protein kinase, partial [Streptosporangiaceae bacterium]|nr:serine/threonine-protein kinase [Streptosporangiaceae bacterium]